MNKSKHTGTKISEYPSSLSNTTNKKYKLLYDHFLMSYAPVNFGISTINKNYRIPIQALRDDIKYYIGIENAKGDWRNLIKVWSGDWVNEDKTKSYVYEWKSEEQGSNDYIIDKFKSNEDDYDRIFFIKNAPIPLESEQDDPAPESNKFVNKKYIDDRFNGIRKVTVDDTTLEIRPYPCVYEYSEMPSSINIVDTLTLEDERTIKDCIEKNCLIFYIKLPTPTSTTLSVKAKNVDTKWGFSGELTQLLSTAKKNGDSGLIKCYAEYINGTFTVHCTNGMNLKPGEGGTVTIDTTDTIVDGSDAVPTSNAVYDHVKSHEDKNIHITSIERTSWNNNITNTTNHINNSDIHITDDEKTSWNNKIDSITSDDFINCSKNDTNVSLSLNTTDEIIDSDIHVPTSESIYETLVARTKIQETSQTINSISSDISGNTQGGQGTYYGFYFTPSQAMSIQSIKIKGVTSIGQNVSASTNTIENCHIKIFSRERNLVSSSLTTKTLDDNGYLVWEVAPFIAKAGTQYIVTFNTNNTGNSFEKGYAIYFTPLYKSYENITPQPFGLVNNSLSNASAGWTPEIQLNYKVIVERTDCEIPNEFYGEYLNNHHNISHKFDYNITQKQVKSYQDGTVTFADDSQIQYDIYPATIANYAFRQSSTESLRTLEEFNTREHSGATGTGRNQYFYYERDYYSQKSNGSLIYDDDAPSQGGSAKPLTNLINGSNMFIRSKLSSFNDSLSSLQIGRQMFAQNRHLIEFRSALPSLTHADKMFLGTPLTTFRTKLPSLSMAECMFRACPHLKYIDTCLPNLTFAQGMFGLCINLQRVDLSKNSGISLYNADDMFAGCQSLTHCMLDLSYLETGENMFGKAGIDTTTTINGITLTAGTTYNNPTLDLESVKFMCETIRDWSNPFTLDGTLNTAAHKITFGINQTEDQYNISSDSDTENYKHYIKEAEKRGWEVEVLPKSFTYNLSDDDIVSNLTLLQEEYKNDDGTTPIVGTRKVDNIHAFSLSKAYFVGENEERKIKRIIITNDGSENGWSKPSEEAYMALRFIKDGNITGDSVYWSNNTSKFNSASKQYLFNFEEINLPTDYDIIRVALVPKSQKDNVTFNDNFVPNETSSRYLFRSYMVSNGESQISKNNCYVYWPGQNQRIIKTVVQFN